MYCLINVYLKMICQINNASQIGTKIRIFLTKYPFMRFVQKNRKQFTVGASVDSEALTNKIQKD